VGRQLLFRHKVRLESQQQRGNAALDAFQNESADDLNVSDFIPSRIKGQTESNGGQ
jgi:hypothetical protein